MSRWLVNRKDAPQQSVGGLEELRDMARSGRLVGADLIQPPGADGWLYALEIEQLADVLPEEDPDDLPVRGGLNGIVIAALALALVFVGGAAAWRFSQDMPDVNMRLIGDGALSYSQMVVTAPDASLRSEPEAKASIVGPAPQNEVLNLLAKRGEFYRARSQAGAEGWIRTDDVLPTYLLGGGDVMKEHDPLYNPDRYLMVQNASWMQLPEQRAEQITSFQFMLRNTSRYDMTGLVLLATIKDAKGHTLETVEFTVEGVVPAEGDTMVGTIAAGGDDEARRLITQATFGELAEADPDLRLRYSDGVDVKMSANDFTEATIDIVELRALPGGGRG